MKYVTVLLATCLVALASGCATARSPVTGFIYSDVQAPNSTNAAPVLSTKMGEACATSILGIVGTGDASISTAARNAGIKHVTHVDETAYSVIGVYAKFCTRVYGT